PASPPFGRLRLRLLIHWSTPASPPFGRLRLRLLIHWSTPASPPLRSATPASRMLHRGCTFRTLRDRDVRAARRRAIRPIAADASGGRRCAARPRAIRKCPADGSRDRGPCRRVAPFGLRPLRRSRGPVRRGG